MSTPKTYTTNNKTGCCAVPNIEDWNEKEIIFENKPFIRMHTTSILFMPLNMGKVMTKIQQIVTEAQVTMPPEEAMILSRDLSPWKAEQLYAVNRPIDRADNVTLNSTFLSKVFEGPYQNARKWFQELQDFAAKKNKKVNKTYFFYTTCPKCAKHYGKNYTIGLVDVS